jgi:hypothetical protein
MENNAPIGATHVLDKGYVKVISASPSGKQFQEMRSQIFRGVIKESLIEIPRVILKIKCPYVVLHAMQSTKIRIVTNYSRYEAQVYEPQVTDIRSGNHEKDVQLSDYISSTLSALIVNQTTLQQDGCNGFIAGLTTPIAAYWEGIVYGDLSDWIDVITAPNAPNMIKAYQNAFNVAISTEFLELEEIIRVRRR